MLLTLIPIPFLTLTLVHQANSLHTEPVSAYDRLWKVRV